MDFQSPTETLKVLVSVFPEFNKEWKDENPYINEDGTFSIHSVWMVFLEFLSRKKPSINPAQLKQIILLIDGAVAAGGKSENAVSTCFLEHLHQIGIASTFKPLMSNEAKRRLHP